MNLQTNFIRIFSERPSRPIFIFILISAVLSNLVPVKADIIFPARVEIKETTAGEFDVLFTLPIINNKKLKAELVLPEVCRDLTEHTVTSTYTSYIETWKVACNSEELFGQSITIKGLMGTYIELMLQVDMLDGRSYSTTLKSSSSSYQIPEPLSLLKLILKSGYFGMRNILMRPEIYLLLFVLIFFISSRKKLISGLITYVLTHLIGQYMAQGLLLKLSPYLAPFVIFVIVLFPAFDLVNGRPPLQRWFQPVCVLALILGFLTGGTHHDMLPLQGLSYNEQHVVTFGSNLGITIGLILIYLLMGEFKQLLTRFVLRIRPQKAHQILGYMIGISTCGLFVYQSTILLIIPSILPEVSLEFLIFPLFFGLWFWQTDILSRKKIYLICMLVMGLGLTIGGFGLKIPFDSLILFSCILIICAQLIFTVNLSPTINLAIAVITAFSYGWTASQTIFENLTLPIANTIGFAILSICLFFITYNFFSDKPQKANIRSVRILATVMVLLTLASRISEYNMLYDREIATNLAMGKLTIPVLSLLLLIGTLVAWPRKRKIHQHLDIESTKPVKHWGIILLSFLILPFGHVTVNNPLFKAHAPEGNEAKLILQQALANTYHAFNLNNEEELYQKLATSVTADLVANIYLDSRRRLTAGVRKGGEVSVRNVSVLSIGDLIEGTNPSEGFSYSSKWAVTARVKHLQHVHHRKNIYSGILTIKVEDNLWKISYIDLQSEDRMIVSGSQG